MNQGTRLILFIAKMSIGMALMLFVLMDLKTNYLSLIVIYGLFTYIIAKELIEYIRCCRRHRQYTWPITFIFSRTKIKGLSMEFTLQPDEVLPFKVGKPIDADGEEADIQSGSLVKKSSDTSIFDVQSDPDFPDDDNAGLVVPVDGVEGEADLVITGDADLGDGVETIQAVAHGIIRKGHAVGFGPLTFGVPRKKTPPPTT